MNITRFKVVNVLNHISLMRYRSSQYWLTQDSIIILVDPRVYFYAIKEFVREVLCGFFYPVGFLVVLSVCVGRSI